MRVSKLSNKRALLVTLIVIVSVLMASVALMIGVIASEEHDYGQSIKSVQVATSAQVHIRFKYNSLGEGYDKYVYEVLDPSGTQVRTGDCVITKVEDADGVTRSLISVALKPTEMTHTVKVYPTSEEYGNGKAIERSVQQYAASVLSQSKYADSHDVVRALLNYGAQTQLKWTVATNNLANDGVFARGTNPVSAVTAVVGGEKPPETDKTGTAFTAAGANLMLLENNVALSFSVTSETATAVSVKISRGDKVLVDNSVVGKDGVYTAQVGNIGVNLYDDEYTVVFTADTGTPPLTLNVSVLDYLSVKINDSDAEIKNIAKAMYQFYMLATGNTGAADCTHGASSSNNQKEYYWIASDANSSFYKCSHCFAQLSTVAVSNDVEFYMPAGKLNGYSTDYFKKEVMTEGEGDDAFDYLHITEATRNTSKYMAFTLLDASNTQVTGQYLVMKFRLGANGLGQTVFNIYASAKSGGANWDKGLVQVKVSEDGQWHTVVVDIAARAGEYFPKNGDNYIAKTLQFRLFQDRDTTTVDNEYLDIAYIAMVDDLASVSNIIKEKTYELSIDKSTSGVMDKATHDCITHAPGAAEASDGDNGAKVYTTKCVACGNILDTRTVTTGVPIYIPANVLATDRPNQLPTTDAEKLTPSTYYDMNSYGVKYDEVPYFSFSSAATPEGTTSIYIWNRDDTANTETTTQQSPYEIYEINAGKAHYVVIKARSNDATQNLEFGLSTVGEKRGLVNICLGTEWTTFVVDAAELMINGTGASATNAYVPNDEDGNYDIDTFWFNIPDLTEEENIDIAYIAFAEEYADIATLTGEDTVSKVKNKAGELVEVKSDGTCIECKSLTYSDTGETGERTYKYTCSDCGKTIVEYNIPSSVTAFMSPDTLGKRDIERKTFEATLHPHTHYALKDNKVSYESDVTFFTYGHNSDTSTYGHETATQIIWARGNGSGTQLTPVSIGEARYLVIKMRAQHEKTLTIRWSTTADTASKENDADVKKNDVVIPYSASKDATDWTTYVIDMKKCVANYDTAAAAEGGIKLDLFILQTANAKNDTMKLDIAYMAFVEAGATDEWSEVAKILGDDKTVYVNATNLGARVDPETRDCIVHAPADPTTTNTTDTTTYTFKCKVCGETVETKTVPASVSSYYYSVKDYASASKYLGVTAMLEEDGTVFVRSTNRQLFFYRSQKDFNKNEKSSQTNTKNIGQSNYLVLRLRSSSAIRQATLHYSTEGCNQTPTTDVGTTTLSPKKYYYTPDGLRFYVNESGEMFKSSNDSTDAATYTVKLDSVTYNSSNNWSNIVMPFDAVGDGEWATYVINLSEVMGDQHKIADGAEAYVVDSLFWDFDGTGDAAYSTGALDIEYMAFVSDWSDIDALTGAETTFVEVTGSGEYQIVDVAGNAAN